MQKGPPEGDPMVKPQRKDSLMEKEAYIHLRKDTDEFFPSLEIKRHSPRSGRARFLERKGGMDSLGRDGKTYAPGE